MEVKEVLSLLGAPETIDTIDGVKEHLGKTFIARTLAVEDDEIKSKVVGSVLGKINTAAMQQFSFTPSQIKDKKVEEIIEMGVTNFKKQIEDAKKSSGEPAKEIKEWEDKYNNLTGEKNSLQVMLDSKVKEWEKEKEQLTGAVKSSKIGFIMKDAVSKVKLKDGITPAEQIGFNTVLNSDYRIDLADDDEVQIFGKDGKRLPKENNTGFMTLDELIPTVAKKLGVLKMNNAEGGKKVTTGTSAASSEGNNGRKIAPRKF